MEFLKNTILLAGSFLILCSCKKDEASSSACKTPTALVVTATPVADGSGTVSFTATADCATNFAFEFGDGVSKSVASGNTDYQYTLAGTNTFTVNVTAYSSAGGSVKKSVDVTVTVGNANNGLIWSDEFSTNGAPDAAKWGYDLGSGGWGNGELQYYTNSSSNVFISDGTLKIKVIKENVGGSAYTSSRLLSKGKFDFKYGKVEVSAKLPVGAGTWPAIWMLGADINTNTWPACGEIDIMEHKGNDLNKIYSTLHYPGRFGGNADGNTLTIANATTSFHVYGLEWSATTIKMTVDGYVVHSVPNTASIPFNHNFFMLLNVAMGGSFGGTVDPNFTNATMEVDYIRVYK